ncbi:MULTISPECIES: peptidoglycan-binding protein [Bacillaceae]|uniref:Peptidoglycan-binding protein n=1 Tax=Evansella alkalicola TaxID=745819 RepID=A0ABS6JVP6_9BACI|nr:MULTISPECIES: peptidoglycan-binding protein [Bacillaceae]MBU9722629.1 peptidoglycan-binding protein [Bacillus alkalicola]
MSSFQSKLGATLITSVAATGVLFAAPSIAEASFGSKNLSFGMEGPDVVILQERLKEEGFFRHHTATGYFGQITRQAVQEFQRANQLAPDGIVGPKTFSVLNSERKQQNTQTQAQTQPASNNSQKQTSNNNNQQTQKQQLQQLKTNQVLRTGARGNEVVKLQEYLKKAGFFDHHTATGYFGSVTDQAVRNFQRARGLKVDGVAGPQTIGAINKEITNTSTNKNTSNTSSSSSNNVSNSNSSSSNTNNNGTSAQHTVNNRQVTLDEMIRSNIVLRQGNQGAPVSAIQTVLTELGFYTNSITGEYGSRTVTAVRDFQRSANIKVDGIAGPQTFRALVQALEKNSGSNAQTGNQNQNQSQNNAAPAPTPVQETNPTENNVVQVNGFALLREGSQGDNVYELQNRLKALGHFSQEATGFFGPVTRQAVVEFQRRWGLIADGLVGQATWRKLDEVSSIHLEDTEVKPTGSFNVMNLIADAATYIGTPYLWGGTTGGGFDCSGFIQYMFKKNNVHLPRTVAEQWNATTAVSKPKVGDIVYFETYKTGPSHNGIYIGNNQFIHSGSSSGVAISSLNNSYWSSRYLGARKIR